MRNCKRQHKLMDHPHAKILLDPLYLRAEDEEKYLTHCVKNWKVDAQRIAGYDLLKDAHRITVLIMMAMLHESNSTYCSNKVGTIDLVRSIIDAIPSILIRLRCCVGDNMLGKDKSAMATEIYLAIWEDSVKWFKALNNASDS